MVSTAIDHVMPKCSCFWIRATLMKPFKQEDTDELSGVNQPSSPSLARETKGWWRASEPPEESFSDVDEGQEWRFQIIGEEVDGSGKVWYEVRWDDWSRADGTKTTWEDGSKISTNAWDNVQRRIRQEKAATSFEIDVPHTTDIHNTLTYLRNQAYVQMAKRLPKEPQPNFMEEMNRNITYNQEIGNIPASYTGYTSRTQRSSTRQKIGISVPSSSSALRSRSRLSMQSSFATSSAASESSPQSLAKRSPMKLNRRRIDSPDSDTPIGRPSRRPASPTASQSRPVSVIDKFKTPAMQRMALQNLWSSKAKKWGAASISFCNDIDDEAIPPISPNFCYLEASYKFAINVTKPTDDFLVKCSCHECLDASSCGCQDASEIVDNDGNRIFAYSRSGFFNFNIPSGTEVIECNKLCSCSLYRCRNRISQRPRDIPVEVFKCSERGWGVRPLIDVKCGKVIGLYTGLVIKREAACGSLTSYCFDLDGDEGEGRELAHEKLTVDSRLHGNWTRFINHSCTPNLAIYLVVHDTPPNTGSPFVVFVASCDICAGTEFTLDYNPKAAKQELQTRKKGKTRENIPEGAMTCLCGSSQCRGYL